MSTRRPLHSPGKLDTTFGKKGVFATTNNQTTANAVAIQGGGKIVIAGTGPSSGQPSNTLIRLNTNGTLDTSFGTGGVVSIVNREAYFTSGFFAVAIQPNGKILAASAAAIPPSFNGIQVVRVESSGKLDTSFGTEGFTPALTSIPGNNTGNMALQPDGKILLACGDVNPSAMARFTSSGQLDPTFGSGGIVNLVNPGRLKSRSSRPARF